ncbi:MAG: Druantia anti-phage system protein DruA [Methylococcales bacterium]
MLEISTCGAIPPYQHLLAGKLAALLLFSPRIADDYRRTYSDPSIISSQLKNSPVVRDNTLVYLGTTSLYTQGSSQYERIRLPAGLINADQSELGYRRVGRTEGYGTRQFLDETRSAVEKFMGYCLEFRDVNSIFGEGPSPKLRKLVAGLRALGFPPDTLMQHKRERLIYAAELAPQARDFLNARTPACRITCCVRNNSAMRLTELSPIGPIGGCDREWATLPA